MKDSLLAFPIASPIASPEIIAFPRSHDQVKVPTWQVLTSSISPFCMLSANHLIISVSSDPMFSHLDWENNWPTVQGKLITAICSETWNDFSIKRIEVNALVGSNLDRFPTTHRTFGAFRVQGDQTSIVAMKSANW